MNGSLILDTNVYSNLLKGDPAAVQAIGGVQQLIVPLPVIAELRYGFLNGSKPEENETKLQRFLAQAIVEIASPDMQTTEHFARLHTYVRQKARALSHNDLWIAALAEQNRYDLVTFDQDFAVFRPLLGKRLHILGT
jgi:predicted nucleic acid-binding protein